MSRKLSPEFGDEEFIIKSDFPLSVELRIDMRMDSSSCEEIRMSVPVREGIPQMSRIPESYNSASDDSTAEELVTILYTRELKKAKTIFN